MKKTGVRSESKSVRIVVRVEPELANWLANRAEKADSSVGWLVRKALRKLQADDKSGQLSFNQPEFQFFNRGNLVEV